MADRVMELGGRKIEILAGSRCGVERDTGTHKVFNKMLVYC